MIKPIRLTDSLKSQIVTQFLQKLEAACMAEGRISITQDFVYKNQSDLKAKVVFTTEAYRKMMALVDGFECEVAWHGLVTREEDTFTITDILVYPQEVSAATVNTDQEAYDEWLRNLDDDSFNAMHFQGHSHVNMATSPSQTDLTHQTAIIKQLGQDDFYIFLIVNKRREMTWKVFDGTRNVLFEGDSVEVDIPDDPLATFVSDARKLVVRRYGNGYTYNANTGKTTGGKTTSSDGKTYGSNWNKGKKQDTKPKNDGAFAGTPTAKQILAAYQPQLPAGIDPDDYDEWIFGAAH